MHVASRAALARLVALNVAIANEVGWLTSCSASHA